jgi:hypothetical protein
MKTLQQCKDEAVVWFSNTKMSILVIENHTTALFLKMPTEAARCTFFPSSSNQLTQLFFLPSVHFP